MKGIVDAILEVLEKKEGVRIRHYLSMLPENSSWFIVSDYCVNNSDKYNDVITFSLLCNYDDCENIKDLIARLAPKDLKKTNDINFEFLQYINSSLFYHFSLVIPKCENMLKKLFNIIPLDDILKNMSNAFQDMKGNVEYLNNFFDDAQSRIKLVQREIQKPGHNSKLIREMILTCSLGTSIMYLLQKYSFPKKIAWISDRDAIIDKFDGFAFDYMYFWYEVALSDKDFKKMNTEIIFVEPEKVGLNYFDELVRIPDYIAGALASYDLDDKENISKIKDKYKLMFIDVFSNPINQATLKLKCSGCAPFSVYNFKWMSN